MASYDTAWLAPPFRTFYRRKDLQARVIAKRNKPLLFISNKYRDEFKKGPTNFFSVQTLRILFEYLTPRYTIIYKRFTEEKQKDWEDIERPFEDKEMIRREFPLDVVLFEDLSRGLNGDPEDSNLLLFSLMASSEGFLAVQGGMAVASSYFGGKTSILIKAGKELLAGDYSYFHRFSNTDVHWQTNDTSFIEDVKKLY